MNEKIEKILEHGISQQLKTIAEKGSPITDVFDGNFGTAFRNLIKEVFGIVDTQMNKYITSISGEIYKPLPIDNQLFLLQIYVTPSATYRKSSKGEKGAFVSNLIWSIFDNIENSVLPIVIHGQPGHGKTSTVRMLIHAIVAKQRYEKRTRQIYPLMYEFKNIGRLDNDEIQILNKRTPFIKDVSFFHGKDVVMILDGMDERQITDGSDNALKDFVRNMFRLSAEINEREDSKLNLILTGRSQFVDQIKSAFNTDYHFYKIEDFSRDQIETWLKKYNDSKKIDPPLQYKNLADRHLKDLVGQPILLTISSMMLADPVSENRKLTREQVSRGEIYNTIIEWTYLKRWQNSPNCAYLPDEKIYRRFLQTLAFILFRQGKEEIQIKNLIELLRKDNTTYDLGAVENQKIEDICRNLAVSFFFKGLEENVFSFIHKTIKDYLTVEGMFDLLKERTEIFRPKKPEKSCDDMAKDIYFILGSASLSAEDHIPFLRDIIAARKEEAKELFKPLEVFFKEAQSHRYSLNYENKQNSDPFVTEANVLGNLFYFLTETFNALSEEERKEFYEDGKLALFEEKDAFYKLVSLLNTAGYDRFNKQQFCLNHLNLRKADLDNVNLSGIKLEEADLSEADLSFANLTLTKFSGADLKGTILFKANLEHAYLRETKNLSQDQIKTAIWNETTQHPFGDLT